MTHMLVYGQIYSYRGNQLRFVGVVNDRLVFLNSLGIRQELSLIQICEVFNSEILEEN